MSSGNTVIERYEQHEAELQEKAIWRGDDPEAPILCGCGREAVDMVWISIGGQKLLIDVCEECREEAE